MEGGGGGGEGGGGGGGESNGITLKQFEILTSMKTVTPLRNATFSGTARRSFTGQLGVQCTRTGPRVDDGVTDNFTAER